MKQPNSLEGLFDNYNENQFKDLMSEYNQVAEWMDKNYPEVTFRLDFDLDKRVGVLKCVATIHTTNLYSTNDSLLQRYRVVIDSNMWYDKIKMGTMLKELQPRLKKNIIDDINMWYAQQKEKDAVQQ
jgi:hypothetical protein